TASTTGRACRSKPACRPRSPGTASRPGVAAWGETAGWVDPPRRRVCWSGGQTMYLRDIVLGAAFSLIATPTFADDAAVPPISPSILPSVLRGTIAKIDATSISIRKADGTSTTVALAPNASFSTVVRRDFGQIKATDFIGVT